MTRSTPTPARSNVASASSRAAAALAARSRRAPGRPPSDGCVVHDHLEVVVARAMAPCCAVPPSRPCDAPATAVRDAAQLLVVLMDERTRMADLVRRTGRPVGRSRSREARHDPFGAGRGGRSRVDGPGAAPGDRAPSVSSWRAATMRATSTAGPSATRRAMRSGGCGRARPGSDPRSETCAPTCGRSPG